MTNTHGGYHRSGRISRRVPEVKSREELAEFWDTHDASDYWDELRPLEVTVPKKLLRGITIRFDEQTLDQLRREAHAKGISPTTLARMWILERLTGAGADTSR